MRCSASVGMMENLGCRLSVPLLWTDYCSLQGTDATCENGESETRSGSRKRMISERAGLQREQSPSAVASAGRTQGKGRRTTARHKGHRQRNGQAPTQVRKYEFRKRRMKEMAKKCRSNTALQQRHQAIMQVCEQGDRSVYCRNYPLVLNEKRRRTAIREALQFWRKK